MKKYVAKTIYLLSYCTIAILASIFASELNAHGGDINYGNANGNKFPRYQWCKLAGTQEQMEENSCVRIATDAYFYHQSSQLVVNNRWVFFDASKSTDKEIANAQQLMFNISRLIAVLNSILFVVNAFGIGCCLNKYVEPDSDLEWALGWLDYFSVINVGLTTSVVAWLFSIENVDAAYNMENNIYFEKYNIIAIAIAMLVFSIVDVLVIIFEWLFEWYSCPLHCGCKDPIYDAVPQNEKTIPDNPLRF